MYSRTKDDADIKKFRCLLYIPKDIANYKAKKGIILFNTIGNYGVKSITTEYLREFFKEFNIVFETRSISVLSFLKYIIETKRLKKITFIKNRMNYDDFENMFVNSGREEKAIIYPDMKPYFVSYLESIFANKKNQNISEVKRGNEIIEIQDEKYDDIKLVIKIGARERTVSLQSIEKLSIIEEIPEEIFENREKDVDKFINYMLSVIDEYKEQINLYDEVDK